MAKDLFGEMSDEDWAKHAGKVLLLKWGTEEIVFAVDTLDEIEEYINTHPHGYWRIAQGPLEKGTIFTLNEIEDRGMV